jgi:crotonobetainyl-CoA:carnitine CoA-transferase CaiB-like acyl-CoA transferase
LAAHQLKEGILLALMNRMKTGKGMKVSVSLFDAAISSLANQASNFLNVGFIPGLQGSLHPNIAPYGEIFETKDKKLITFAIGSDKQFKNLLYIIGKEELLSDKRFSLNSDRVKNRKELFMLLQKKVNSFKTSELKKKCIAAFVPMAQIKNLKEVFSDNRAKKLVQSQRFKKSARFAPKSFIGGLNINI